MSTNRTLRAVPSTTSDQTPQRTETEEKLWQALRTSPGSTATALSVAAGIGKSTAPKVLSRWLKGGLVARSTGIADGGSRSAARWLITTDDQLTVEHSTDQPSDELTTEPPPGDQPTDELPPDEQSMTRPRTISLRATVQPWDRGRFVHSKLSSLDHQFHDQQVDE